MMDSTNWDTVWQEEDYLLRFRLAGCKGNREYFEYEFYHKDELMFAGNDFSPSPMHSSDSNEAIASLLSFLSLQPGDTDDEYFEDYTSKQLEFACDHGENLMLWVSDLEESAQ